jgi:formamidopyrimidine-DNA glycosylase
MPELPEVESACRLLRHALIGHEISAAEAVTDDIVFVGTPTEAIEAALVGRTVQEVCRKGKYWWLAFGDAPFLIGHLGMTGSVTDLTPGADSPTGYLRRGHERFSTVREVTDRPRFLKLMISTNAGTKVAFTDGRRLARMWLSNDPLQDPRILKLGFDAYEALPSAAKLAEILQKRKAPMKAVLLDQGTFAGIGNYLADEVLYQSKIAPARHGASLTLAEVRRLHDAIVSVLAFAVKVDADYEKFPPEWLFHHRWGGKSGTEEILGRKIRRETIGGRTTAWVPEIQK